MSVPKKADQYQKYQKLIDVKASKANQIFHVMSSEWMKKWKDYVTEKSSEHPGPINQPLQLQKLCVDNSGPKITFLPFCDDFMNNL